MSKKLFVGNIPWSIKTAQMEELFSSVGTITDCIVMTDRDTGRSRGFGFVTFESDEAAETAIEQFNGKEVDGRELVVNVAKERERF